MRKKIKLKQNKRTGTQRWFQQRRLTIEVLEKERKKHKILSIYIVEKLRLPVLQENGDSLIFHFCCSVFFKILRYENAKSLWNTKVGDLV